MSAPTLWEEGRWSATRVTRLSMFACVLLVGIDLIRAGGLGIVFDTGFVLMCIAMALAVRPAEFFRIGTLPPMLLIGVAAVLSLADRDSIAGADDGFVQAIISGLAHHAGALFAGYALCLAVLVVRQRVLTRRGVEVDLLGPETVVDDDEIFDYSNREVSPDPYRVISGNPEVKSTTVVGSEPDSPSITASTT